MTEKKDKPAEIDVKDMEKVSGGRWKSQVDKQK
jgi:hypothetical protein